MLESGGFRWSYRTSLTRTSFKAEDLPEVDSAFRLPNFSAPQLFGFPTFQLVPSFDTQADKEGNHKCQMIAPRTIRTFHHSVDFLPLGRTFHHPLELSIT